MSENLIKGRSMSMSDAGSLNIEIGREMVQSVQYLVAVIATPYKPLANNPATPLLLRHTG